MKKKCAVVGIGHRSKSWIDAIVKYHPEKNELSALCDAVPARCEDINRHYQTTAAVYSDFDRMLNEIKPDITVVCSPEHVHAQHIVKALDAGSDVATEKPLCVSAKDAVTILDAEKRNHKKIHMGFNYRHIPLCSKIRELIQDGVIGRPLSVDLTWYLDYFGHGASYFRRWHRLIEKSGGLLITKATHHFDLINWWVGDRPASVYARCELNCFGKDKGRFAGTRCRDCGHKTECDFFYDISDRSRKARELGYEILTVRDYEGDTCVFSPDIDIYDTMSVMVQYQNGCILSYSLNATVPFEGWNLAINGTDGRLESNITDAKPSRGAEKFQKVMRKEGGVMKREEYEIVDWPANYTIHVMPHRSSCFELDIPNIADGHGGGDFRIFKNIFDPDPDLKDPLGIFASAIDGAMSMGIGNAANRSAAEGQPVSIKDLFGEWA